MRSLSPDLLAAQRSASAVPYLKVTVADRVGGITRPAFERLYSGSEPDGYHAATMPSDSSLLRARVASGRLYYQRVTDPGPTSDFSSWTDLGAAAGPIFGWMVPQWGLPTGTVFAMAGTLYAAAGIAALRAIGGEGRGGNRLTGGTG